jgi:hypothetical protein
MDDNSLSSEGMNRSTCFPISIAIAEISLSLLSSEEGNDENDGDASEDANIPTTDAPSFRTLRSKLFNADDAYAHRNGTNGARHFRSD